MPREGDDLLLRLGTFFDDAERELHRDILRLLSVPSVSENRGEARRALQEFLALAQSSGFVVQTAAGGDIGTASLEPDEAGPCETLGILAHVDVVDAGDPAAWARSPWGEIADGAVWGRGALDDKGPLVICLWAVRALRALGLPFRKRVKFIVGTMEEIEWRDMDAYLREAPPPDFGFTPDGEFPVTNREKGYCDAVLSFDCSRHRALGDFEIVGLRAGTAINAVPDYAEAILRPNGDTAELSGVQALLEGISGAERSKINLEFRGERALAVQVRGRAAHSSLPEQGDNALVRLCVFLSRLGRNGFVDFVADSFSKDPVSRALNLQTRPEYALGEYVGSTSASPDLAEDRDSEFLLTINLRTAWRQTEEELRSAFGTAGEQYGFSFRLRQFLPALFIPKDRPFMKALLGAYERGTGRTGGFLLAPGTSYAKAMPGVTAFGPVLPGHPDLCHRTDERMDFEEIRTCALIYADAIAAIVSSAEPMA